MDKLRAQMAAHWPYAVVGGVAGVVAAWIVMVFAQTYRQGFALIINSDVIGAAIGAALTITGTVFITNRSRAHDDRKQHEQQSRFIKSVLDLIEAEIEAGQRYSEDDRLVEVPPGRAIANAKDHLHRYRRATIMAAEARLDMRGSDPALLAAFQSVQLALSKAVTALEVRLRLDRSDKVPIVENLVRDVQSFERTVVEVIKVAHIEIDRNTTH